jgi:cytochrome c oxidase subunit I+III
MYDEFLGKVNFALYFVGFNLLYFPMFFAWETPRRVFSYRVEYIPWHCVSTVGGFLLGLSFLVLIYNLYKSYFDGTPVDGNPWEYATTAEWAVPSPPPLENFDGLPSYETGKLRFLSGSTDDGEGTVADGGQSDDVGTADVSSDGGAVVTADSGEALPADHAEEHVSHASVWPFVIGAGAFVVLVGLSGLQQGTYPDGVVGSFYAGTTVLGGGILLWALVRMTGERFHGPTMNVAERWPFAGVDNMKTGMWIFLASDVVLFGAFVGSYTFIRVAEGWRNWHHLVPEEHVVMPGLINTYLLLTSSFAVVLALVFAERNNRLGVVGSLVATLGLGVGFLINKAIEWNHLFHLHSEAFPHGWELSTNVASSTFYLTTGLHGAHVTVGLVIALYMIVRAWNGAYTGEGSDDSPIENFGLYWHFVDIVWLFLFPLFYIL